MPMRSFEFVWDENTNLPHLADHDVLPEEAEWVVEHAAPEDRTRSRSSGNHIAFGYTRTGRYLAVVYWFVDKRLGLIYIETAYDTPLPSRRRHR